MPEGEYESAVEKPFPLAQDDQQQRTGKALVPQHLDPQTCQQNKQNTPVVNRLPADHEAVSILGLTGRRGSAPLGLQPWLRHTLATFL